MGGQRQGPNYVPLAVGVGLLVFCVVGVLVNRRPIGDIVLMVLGGLVLVALVGYYVGRPAVRRRRERERRAQAEREAKTPWRHYSHPDPDTGDWLVGVERVTDDGRALNRVHLRRFRTEQADSPERYDAEGQAIALAATYNGGRVGA